MAVFSGRFAADATDASSSYASNAASASSIRALVEFVLGLACSRFGGELLAHGLERLHLAGAHLVEPNDVKAEVGAHGLAELADLQREQRVLERPDEHAAAHPAEVAALRLRAGVGRDLGRHGGKVLAAA